MKKDTVPNDEKLVLVTKGFDHKDISGMNMRSSLTSVITLTFAWLSHSRGPSN